MYEPQAIKKKNRAVRLQDSIITLCRQAKKMAGPGSRSRKTGSVGTQKRTWKVKKLLRATAFCSVIILLLSGSVLLSYIFMAKSDIFRITELAVEGNSLAPDHQILDRAQMKRGQNMLSLNPEKVEGIVREHPWIDQVDVRRLWPSRVEIHVREHKPLALVNLDQEGRSRLFYVNRKGEVFAPSTPSRDIDYPVLTGEALGKDVRGKQVRPGTLSALAIDFLNMTAKGNQILPAQAVSEVHVSHELGLVVYLVDHPFPIYMGHEKIRMRFGLLVRVLEQLYRKDKVKEVAEIRMDYADDKILVANVGT